MNPTFSFVHFCLESFPPNFPTLVADEVCHGEEGRRCTIDHREGKTLPFGGAEIAAGNRIMRKKLLQQKILLHFQTKCLNFLPTTELLQKTFPSFSAFYLPSAYGEFNVRIFPFSPSNGGSNTQLCPFRCCTPLPQEPDEKTPKRNFHTRRRKVFGTILPPRITVKLGKYNFPGFIAFWQTLLDLHDGKSILHVLAEKEKIIFCISFLNILSRRC